MLFLFCKCLRTSFVLLVFFIYTSPFKLLIASNTNSIVFFMPFSLIYFISISNNNVLSIIKYLLTAASGFEPELQQSKCCVLTIAPCRFHPIIISYFRLIIYQLSLIFLFHSHLLKLSAHLGHMWYSSNPILKILFINPTLVLLNIIMEYFIVLPHLSQFIALLL